MKAQGSHILKLAMSKEKYLQKKYRNIQWYLYLLLLTQMNIGFYMRKEVF